MHNWRNACRCSRKTTSATDTAVMKETIYHTIATITLTGFMSLALLTTAEVKAQSVADELKADANRSAGTYYALNLAKPFAETPPPDGKKPFYINHYGCSSSYYLDRPSSYEGPYATLLRADSLGKLTKLGRDVLQRINLLRTDAKDRTSEMTSVGKQIIRKQMKQLKERYPNIFNDHFVIDGRSVVQNHFIQTMNEAIVEVVRDCTPKKVIFKSSHKYMPWMNPQDRQLTALRTNQKAVAALDEFTNSQINPSRLMESLFNDQEYVSKHINAMTLTKQLFTLAGSQQHTTLGAQTKLYDIFTPEEIYGLWRSQNAQDYIFFGNCTLSGGTQAYLQRHPLWNMLHIGDSIANLNTPVVHLRYTNSGVILSLATLLELNDFNVRTGRLDSLEAFGWTNYQMAPVGGRIEMIHYKRDKDDDDMLIKVMLNGREARLPIKTDCPPYYHWNDVKRHYLRKLYRYEKNSKEAEEKAK